MKHKRFVLAMATMVGVWSALPAFGQTQTFPWRAPGQNPAGQVPIIKPQDIQRGGGPGSSVLIGFRQDKQGLQDTQPSASDVQQQTPAPQAQNDWTPATQQTVEQPAPGLAVSSNATCGSEECRRRGFCNLGCERKLIGTTRRGLEIGGWTSVGYHNRNTPLLNNREDEVNLHQVWFYFDKQADPNCGSWSLGYRADLLYGVDGQELQAFGNPPTGTPSGWDNGWDYGAYGWALPQAYVQLANYDWDIKIGKFFAPYGYEGIGSRDNYFYSHTYTAFYTNPRTMTGVVGERFIGDNNSVIIGASSGWDTGFDANSGLNAILGFSTQPNEFIDFTLTASFGDTGFRDSGTFTSSVTRVQLTNAIRYIGETSVLDLADNQEFGHASYLIRDFTPCLSMGARLDWWKSDRFNGGATSSTYSFTTGANYKVNSNFKIRPEVRVDWGALAVENGELIFGIDGVLTF